MFLVTSLETCFSLGLWCTSGCCSFEVIRLLQNETFSPPPLPPLFLRAPVKSAGNTLLALKTLLSSLIVPNLFLKESKKSNTATFVTAHIHCPSRDDERDTRATRVASPLRLRLGRIAPWDCMVKQKPLPRRNFVKILNFFSCFNTK